MTTVIFVLVMIAATGLGAWIGFGRTLKLFVRGIFGTVVSVMVCFMIGGTVQSIEPVRAFIASIGIFGTIVYYVLLFIGVTILRKIIINIICRLDGLGKGGKATLLSRILGATFAFSFCFGLTLLFLAGVKAIETTSFAQGIIENIKNSILWLLYQNNIIVF